MSVYHNIFQSNYFTEQSKCLPWSVRCLLTYLPILFWILEEIRRTGEKVILFWKVRDEDERDF